MTNPVSEINSIRREFGPEVFKAYQRAMRENGILELPDGTYPEIMNPHTVVVFYDYVKRPLKEKFQGFMGTKRLTWEQFIHLGSHVQYSQQQRSMPGMLVVENGDRVVVCGDIRPKLIHVEDSRSIYVCRPQHSIEIDKEQLTEVRHTSLEDALKAEYRRQDGIARLQSGNTRSLTGTLDTTAQAYSRR